MKLSILIPVFDERATVTELLRRVLAAELGDGWTREVLVVDDGSRDGTREILERFVHPEVRVFFHPTNRGKGAAVRTALAHATGDYCITQDADLEYDPSDYAALLEKAAREGLDAVYGSRTLAGRSYHHYAANAFAVAVLTQLTNVFFGARFTDVATNYKLVRTSLLRSFELTCEGFDLDCELTDKVALRTKRIGEVPIRYAPRTYREGKKIGFADGLSSFAVVFRDRFVPERFHTHLVPGRRRR